MNEQITELSYDDFFTQINELNSISHLPESIDFKSNNFLKYLLTIFVFSGGCFISLGAYQLGQMPIALIGFFFFVGISVFLLFSSKAYSIIINNLGIEFNQAFCSWSEIKHIQIILKDRLFNPPSEHIRILLHSGQNIEFMIETMNKPKSYLLQALYMYHKKYKTSGTI